MTDLNSVLVQGRLQGVVQIGQSLKDTSILTMNIVSQRYYGKGEKTEIELTCTKVKAYGKLADENQDIKPNSILRIIGRLCSVGGTLHVVAEHIERR